MLFLAPRVRACSCCCYRCCERIGVGASARRRAWRPDMMRNQEGGGPVNLSKSPPGASGGAAQRLKGTVHLLGGSPPPASAKGSPGAHALRNITTVAKSLCGDTLLPRVITRPGSRGHPGRRRQTRHPRRNGTAASTGSRLGLELPKNKEWVEPGNHYRPSGFPPREWSLMTP